MYFFLFRKNVRGESEAFNGHLRLNVYLSRHFKRRAEEKQCEKFMKRSFDAVHIFISVNMKRNRNQLWLCIAPLLHNISHFSVVSKAIHVVQIFYIIHSKALCKCKSFPHHSTCAIASLVILFTVLNQKAKYCFREVSENTNDKAVTFKFIY